MGDVVVGNRDTSLKPTEKSLAKILAWAVFMTSKSMAKPLIKGLFSSPIWPKLLVF